MINSIIIALLLSSVLLASFSLFIWITLRKLQRQTIVQTDKKKQELFDLQALLDADAKKMSDISQHFFAQAQQLGSDLNDRKKETLKEINSGKETIRQEVFAVKSSFFAELETKSMQYRKITRELETSILNGNRILQMFQKELNPGQFIEQLRESTYSEALSALKEGLDVATIATQYNLPHEEVRLLRQALKKT